MDPKIIIDTDPGIGDAFAIALALLDPELDVVALTATAGSVSGQDATRNIQTLVELMDPPKWPRLGTSEGEATQVDSKLRGGYPSPVDLNGKHGLGEAEFRVADLHNKHESAKVMIDLARTYPHEITLLTLGPLTNVELACERAPEFLSLLKNLVCLGGSIQAGGDITAAAEFNIFANPEAARSVLLSPATKTLVPRDVAQQVVLTFDQLNRIASNGPSPIERFLSEILPFSFRAYHQHLGLEGIRLQEVVALAAVARPQLFSTQAMALDIETTGKLTRGVTVFDQRGIQNWQTNIDVLREVDEQAVLDYLTALVQKSSY